ncbi:MAG: UDP-N-acetylmuramate dehydrogenase [Myxococcales bacterium]|jgi:UDP-N-acetylmuramate dehydrogenase|nr:UDP-N-acetylmuramate dehydrogenase [Myxococcales bacterium]
MDFLDKLTGIDGIELQRNVPMAGHTSFGIGGEADLFATIHSQDALVRLLALCRTSGVAWQLLGAGTNVLVSDRGVRGVVIHIAKDAVEESARRGVNALYVRLSAGTPLTRLLQIMRSNGALGVSVLSGIPGSVGGAVVMNAGTRLGACAQFIEAVQLCDADGIREISPADLHFAYRESTLPNGAIVTSARFKFQLGLAEELDAEDKAAQAAIERRRAGQPSQPSAGCVFCNPGDRAAGLLIDESGLKGLRVGGAEISDVHANFIVNVGNARASDVLDLMRQAQAAVEARFGVSLVPEVRLMGEFDPAELPRHARFSSGLSNLVPS